MPLSFVCTFNVHHLEIQCYFGLLINWSRIISTTLVHSVCSTYMRCYDTDDRHHTILQYEMTTLAQPLDIGARKLTLKLWKLVTVVFIKYLRTPLCLVHKYQRSVCLEFANYPTKRLPVTMKI